MKLNIIGRKFAAVIEILSRSIPFVVLGTLGGSYDVILFYCFIVCFFEGTTVSTFPTPNASNGIQ